LTAVIWAPYIVDRILALGNLVVTGPTRTNVNDYRVILVR
jgi:glycerate-2-kinase